MSDDAKPSLAQRVKSRLELSLAAMVALLVGTFLLCLALVAWLVYSIDPTRIAWGDYMTLGRSVGLLVLWGLSCAVTYWTVRIWMNEVPPGDVRVRQGWNAGTKLLARHGIGLSELPCFVVLGCETRHQQDALMGSDGFTVTHPSSGAAPAIDWHVTEERILIFCRDIGVYGGLLRSGDKRAGTGSPTNQLSFVDADGRSRVRASVDDPGVQDSAAPTNQDDHPSKHELDSEHQQPGDVERGGEDDPVASEESELGKDAFESDDLGDDNDGHSNIGPDSVAIASPRAKTKITGTKSATMTSAMRTLDHARSLVLDAQSITPETVPARSIPDSLSSTKTSACQEQMAEFCACLRSERFPHAPINGTLVLVDSDAITDRSSTSSESGRILGRAIRSDLDQMQAELGIASPVTMMVTENDHADDYHELQRRLRMVEQETSLPLGRAFVSEEIPTVDAMNGLATDAIRMMESRVQTVFQTPRSLSQPQNYRLVRLLIQCRRWHTSLRSLLVESCAVATVSQPQAVHAVNPTGDPGIVSGMFVASTAAGTSGGSSKMGCFFEPVLRHMVDQQNHLAWTSSERQRCRRHRNVVNAIILVTAVLLAMLLAQLFWLFWA
ncbi:hypothetical protein K227x_23590 [Rubripirellula lacrimiformis]|uniref:Type VI secretion system component TssM1 N-terminal domain-containing protein n=1 Tax=Rubripirellula lacrimiformis TaxID=1930273 RepID=A0A517NA18_9BACT|nr:type VI secretion system protein [Rubripirellula lacrimiformis]QDT03973.1 hypothetical protein K227x_23590 [Rubripirellula lacrimiformis]